MASFESILVSVQFSLSSFLLQIGNTKLALDCKFWREALPIFPFFLSFLSQLVLFFSVQFNLSEVAIQMVDQFCMIPHGTRPNRQKTSFLAKSQYFFRNRQILIQTSIPAPN